MCFCISIFQSAEWGRFWRALWLVLPSARVKIGFFRVIVGIRIRSVTKHQQISTASQTAASKMTLLTHIDIYLTEELNQIRWFWTWNLDHIGRSLVISSANVKLCDASWTPANAFLCLCSYRKVKSFYQSDICCISAHACNLLDLSEWADGYGEIQFKVPLDNWHRFHSLSPSSAHDTLLLFSPGL